LELLEQLPIESTSKMPMFSLHISHYIIVDPSYHVIYWFTLTNIRQISQPLHTHLMCTNKCTIQLYCCAVCTEM